MRILLALTFSVILSACGQKGALYLPEAETADVTITDTMITDTTITDTTITDTTITDTTITVAKSPTEKKGK